MKKKNIYGWGIPEIFGLGTSNKVKGRLPRIRFDCSYFNFAGSILLENRDGDSAEGDGLVE